MVQKKLITSVNVSEVFELNADVFYGVRIKYVNRYYGYYNPFNNNIYIPKILKHKPKLLHDYILHEFGHFLQLELLVNFYGRFKGFILFMCTIGLPSFLTAKCKNHMHNWYEINANKLSNAHTGKRFFDKKKYLTNSS